MKDNILDFQTICKKLRPFLGNKIDELFLEYGLAESQEKKQEIFAIILALYSRYVDESMLDQSVILNMPKNDMSADYNLGEISFPNKQPKIFGLRAKDWTRHVCITGMSGSGKTTFALRILSTFIKNKMPFIVFDWKRSFRRLTQLSKDVVIFTVGKPKASNFFRFNVNKPPVNVAPDEWITILCDLFCECYGASYGVHKLLSEVMQKAFRDFGVYSGSDNYPTWYQIRDRLEDMSSKPGPRSRESEWLTSALRIAHSLTFGEFGNTINDKSKHNLGVAEMLENQVVFELDSLGTMEKKFFCSFMLLYIYKHKKANSDHAKNEFSCALVVDEAHNIFLKQKTAFIQESVTDTIYREIREYGISLVCLDQHASKLSDTVIGNSSTNIAFQQIHPFDVDTIAKLMFLYDDKRIFTQLNVGEAVVKLTERYHEPFLLKVKELQFSDMLLTDPELRDYVKKSCLLKKRLKHCEEMIKAENLVKEIRRIEDATRASGVKITNDETIKMQLAVKKDMEKALQIGKKKVLMKNHLQKQIFEEILEVLEQTRSLKEAKADFKARNFNTGDINKAFKLFLETPAGSEIAKFLDLWNSTVAKSRNYPINVFRFLDKLQNTGENLSVTQLYKELCLSARKGNDIKTELEDIGLIKSEKDGNSQIKKLNFTTAGSKFMAKIS
ncbi:MAG: DUF87 domain-containing protein [Nanoarchaeota archaeon]